MHKIGFFTVSSTGKRYPAPSFEAGAHALIIRGHERLIEVFQVIAHGQLDTRERSCTSSAHDYLSAQFIEG